MLPAPHSVLRAPAYNDVVSVAGLASAPALVTLKIQGNAIADLAPLDEIATLRTKLITEADVCKFERDEVFAAGMISEPEYAIYNGRNWGPDYWIAGDRASGINLWIPCARVVRDLPAGQ